MQKPLLVLALAILAETIGTSFLKASNGFSNLWAGMGALAFFGVALWFLSIALKTMPVGIVYAIWSGIGIVLVTIIGFVIFKQSLDWAAYLGIALIIAGVAVINLFSQSGAH